jgi:hypothetical protein
MDWAFDAFSWLAPDLISEILVVLGAAGWPCFSKKTLPHVLGEIRPGHFYTEWTAPK